ncbi:MAG: flagellar biosynthetic protein FliR [Syntrophales bacterium]|jgi:flagellar biosynthetic protein FliR|nr:flagellar biosynthetic protein FliR [Syntrophales bacterium]
MEFPVISVEWAVAFSLVLLRVGALIGTMPLFGEQIVPLRVKAGLTFVVALLLFPAVSPFLPAVPVDFMPLLFRMISEILVGVALGFAARLIFAGIQVAGELIGFKIGFSVANVIDPVSSVSVSLIGQVLYLFALLIFLTTNSHHIFFAAMADSFRILPVLSFHVSGDFMALMMSLARDMFVLAVKLCIPVVSVILFTNIGLGIVARTVPQINVFIVGFPLQISVGLIFFGLSMPLFASLMQKAYGRLGESLFGLLRVMG